MAFQLPFLNTPLRKKRPQFICIDLGTRTTKAILLERRGDLLALVRYAILDAPLYEKKLSVDQMGDHLHSVVNELGNTTKYVSLSLGLSDAMVRQVEFPQIPVDEMRMVLKVNHKNYMQQDLPNHTFDCHIFPLQSDSEAAKQVAAGAPKKFKALVAAAKNQLVSEIMQATGIAGLVTDALTPSLICPLNAFEQAAPQAFANDTVALVDIGFKHSSICIVDRGIFATNRVVNIGGDHFTTGLADAKGITYAEAEGIKIGMAGEVESELQMSVLPLGREIRALLDFFEHQNDRPVSQVYFCGGTARSKNILELLRSEILVECKSWDPTNFLQLALTGQQAVEAEHVGPELTVAIGTALAAY